MANACRRCSRAGDPVVILDRIASRIQVSLSRTFRVISDLLLIMFFKKYQNRPIHFFGTLGIVTFGTGAIIDFYFLILKNQKQSF